MINQRDQFFLDQKEPNRSCLLALRSLILEQNSLVTETQKWGMPCFCFKNKPFCYLWTDKKTTEPYILFVEGNRLDHPLLEEGNRSKMKILRVNPNSDIPVEIIIHLLHCALDLCINGLNRSG